ncbi:hypothetical protein GCM10009765_31690 [Fodinicola feengrottensis]|uniref:Uncharacterized protein n=1 Tax=Fodinicola feengrottensis TaxID=435914 RepID=A0ABP4T0C1_9ACTN
MGGHGQDTLLAADPESASYRSHGLRPLCAAQQRQDANDPDENDEPADGEPLSLLK